MVRDGGAPAAGAGAAVPVSAGVSVAGSTTRSRTTGAAAWWAQAVNPRAQATARRRRKAGGTIGFASLIESSALRPGLFGLRGSAAPYIEFPLHCTYITNLPGFAITRWHDEAAHLLPVRATARRLRLRERVG